jgi:hypothetical protein
VAACALYTPKDNSDGPKDIMKIITSCLKDAKRCKTRCAFKMITQLVAVSKYIKLHTWYKKHKVCK